MENGWSSTQDVQNVIENQALGDNLSSSRDVALSNYFDGRWLMIYFFGIMVLLILYHWCRMLKGGCDDLDRKPEMECTTRFGNTEYE